MNVDPRGQRFNATLSAIVLVIVLITGSGWLLGFQAVVFGIGAVFGLRYAPYGLIYRFAVRPRLGPPAEMEAEAPPRFAQEQKKKKEEEKKRQKGKTDKK